MELKERFIEVGAFALRSPGGDYLPSVPLYIKAEDAGGVNEATGRTVAEEFSFTDLSRIFAEKHRAYVDGVKAAEAEAGKRAEVEA